MGYRLYATIKNVLPFEDEIELGKQYHNSWEDFNESWFGSYDGCGDIDPNVCKGFIKKLKEINNKIPKNSYRLYNIEQLEDLFKRAKKDGYVVSFESY